MENKNYGKNMKLVTSYWKSGKTFRMFPVTENDCPFAEVIYDPLTDTLVLLTKNEKENLQMVPRLDNDGNNVPAKRVNSQTPHINFAQQRITMRVQGEHYIIERDEAEEFIKDFAVNSDTFDYKKFFKEEQKPESKIIMPDTPVITDKAGAKLTVEK